MATFNNYSLNKTIATTVVSPAAAIAAAGLIQNNLSELMATAVFTAPPTPDERYIVARNNLERFSILGTWTNLFIIANDAWPIGWNINKQLHAEYVPTKADSVFYNVINTNAAGVVKSFPLHLNLHLLNVIYYNSLASDFFKDLITLPAALPLDDGKTVQSTAPGGVTNQTITDSFVLQGFDGVGYSPQGSLLGLGTFIRSAALEPYAFPLIIKLPSNEFLFLFVRNWDNNTTNPPQPPPIFDIISLLTPTQQQGITKSEPISSYVAAFNDSGLKVLAYLSVKTCMKPDGTFYYVPTKMHALDNIDLSSLKNDKNKFNFAATSILALKNAYIIAMFSIALKLLGSITLPRQNSSSPHPFDSSLTTAIRLIFNKNYISEYDCKNTSYRALGLAERKLNPFDGHTFFSSRYWGLNKTAFVGDTTRPATATAFIDSYPDLLGLGDISSTSPSNNEIPFIEVSQWDITEGMNNENYLKAYNLKGSTGLIKFSDYAQDVQSFRANGNSAKRPQLVPDKDSGILVSDGTIPNKGFISGMQYDLYDGDNLFRLLREACYKHTTPAQQGNFANAKYVIKSAKKRNLGEPVLTNY